jgi:putative flippase GtrA
MKFIDGSGHRSTAGQIVRFALAGLANSGATYILYLALLAFTPYRVAYTLSFAAGIVISAVLNGYWVFRAGLNTRMAVQLPLVYLFQYVFGLALLTIFVDRAGVPRQLAPLAVLACTVPVTFALTRYVCRAS